ncbi:hypothetical protein FQN54_007500 [Arachnomyces sp. PD_36]|nr:hypothetical protein FQN54_007500 [Arachnomyces sp. PD_36]
MRTRGFLWLAPLANLALAIPTAKLSAVNACLNSTDVPWLKPGSEKFEDAIEPFNARLDFVPAALALPETVKQVQAAVACGVKNEVTVSARCGGHSYASHGLGGEDGHLVIDMKKFNTTSVDPDTGIATVGSGLRTGVVAQAIFDDSERAISHGTCPSVGISGLTLHGGYGLISRAHGVTLDNVVELEVVLADSTVVTASKTENEDLFWAMRGAGSSFGIVTHFKFQTFEAPKKNVVFNWNIEPEKKKDAVKVLTVLQDFAIEDQPKEMNLRSFLRGQGMSVEGVYHGTQKDFDVVMEPLLKKLGLLSANETIVEDGDDHREVVGWIEALESYANGPLDGEPWQETFFSKSLMPPKLSPEALTALVDYWFDETEDFRRSYYLLIDLYGGKSSAVTNVPADDTSYAHRETIFKMEFYDSQFFGDYPEDGFDFLNGWVDAIQKAQGEETLGMYINYADPTLTADEAHEKYWLGNYARLSELKDKYDPDQVFMNPQAINSVDKA